jgi:hypothetical protein
MEKPPYRGVRQMAANATHPSPKSFFNGRLLGRASVLFQVIDRLPQGLQRQAVLLASALEGHPALNDARNGCHFGSPRDRAAFHPLGLE